MEALKIEETPDSPGITLDKENNQFIIYGRSLPEDAATFYEPVLKWISEYKKQANEQTNFEFKLEYANTASSKFIQDVMVALEGIPAITVLWYYRADDEDMEATGREFSELVSIPFKFVTY